MAEGNVDMYAGGNDPVRGQLEQTAKGKLKAPETIVPNVSAAQTIYARTRAEHLKRIELYARIEGLIAGNPPYDPVDLAKHGLSHISNFNTLDARAMYERSALAYWNLLNEAEYIATFSIQNFKGINDPELTRYAQIMARNFDYIVKKWPSFYVQTNTLTGQLVKFGISPCFWSDERDWRWRTIELQRFYIPDQALADIEQMTFVCIETTFTVQYLYETYVEFSKPGNKEKSPWNLEALANFLVMRANTFAKQEATVLDIMDLQRKLQNGDLSYDSFFTDSVRLISLLYKEYSGKISHFLFDRFYVTTDFLFSVLDQYETFDECLKIFTASPGDFTIHSNRGVGHKIFSISQAMMQLDCSLVDMARWSSTPMIKTLATGSRDFESIRFYPGVPTNIGTAEFVQNQLGSNINQLVVASQYLSSKMNFNTANSGDDPGVPDRNQGSLSPSQARAKSFREFNVLKNNIAHFYAQYDCVVQNMVVKMMHSKKGYPGYKEAKEWKERCLEEGVPEELFETKNSDRYELPRHLQVKATRVAGDGSQLARIMGLESLFPIAGAFGARGAKEYQRQYVMATMGPEYVQSFLSPEEPDESAGGASLAGVENAVMRAGEAPIFSPDNEHRSHIAVHFGLGNDTIQRLQQQQMTPVDADRIFTQLIPHLQEHIVVISKNPLQRNFVESIRKPWDQLQEYARLNRKNAAAMIQKQIRDRQEQEAQTQQVLTDEQIKNVKAQGDERRADFKVQNQVERAKEANQNRAEVMREKVRLDAQNKRLEIALKPEEPVEIEEAPLPELRQELERINGETIAPADIEPNPRTL